MQPAPQLREALQKVAAAIVAMEAATTPGAFEEAWKDFLHETERFWNKSHSHFKKSPKWFGWAGRHFKARTTDELLSYLINARGAEEHTVEPIMARSGGSMTINPAHGNSMYIEHMEIRNGQIVSLKSPQDLQITFYPARVRLLPVTNRGRTYSVPTSHLGQAVDSENAVQIAKMAHQYYSLFLDEAENFFCQ